MLAKNGGAGGATDSVETAMSQVNDAIKACGVERMSIGGRTYAVDTAPADIKTDFLAASSVLIQIRSAGNPATRSNLRREHAELLRRAASIKIN